MTTLTQLRNYWEPWVAAADAWTINGNQFFIWQLHLNLALKSSGLWNTFSSLPSPEHPHFKQTVVYSLCCYPLFKQAVFLAPKQGWVWFMEETAYEEGPKAPSAFAWGDAETEIMGSVLWAQTGFQRILVKDKLKMTSGDSARRKGS